MHTRERRSLRSTRVPHTKLVDVQFRERFVDEALLVGGVQAAGGDLLGGKRSELGDLALELTQRGAAFGPMRFVSDAKENAAVWRNLKPPHWLASVRALPGSETLAEGIVGAQRLPFVVLRQFGSGRVLYLGADETWRWRYDVADKYQDPFWHQMAAAIMEPPYAVRDKQIALDAGTVNYVAGDAVELRARLRDEQGRAITKGHPRALLYRAGQKVATVTLGADDNSGGAFRGRTGPLVPGNYELRIDATGLVSGANELRAEFFVQSGGRDAARELIDLNCNEELLQQMSRASGGEYCREEDAARLVERLEPLSKGRIEEDETILWQSWWWFVPIIALLTTEWLLRKRAGLI